MRQIQNEETISEEEGAMELEDQELENPYSPERLYKDENHKIEEEISTPKQSTAMILEEEGGKSIEPNISKSGKITRKKWNEETKVEENIPKKETNSFTSPNRIQGYQTPAKEANKTNINNIHSDVGLRKRNKWHKIGGESEEDDIFNIVKERMPIDILVQICIGNVIEEQNRLVKNNLSNPLIIFRLIEQWCKSY